MSIRSVFRLLLLAGIGGRVDELDAIAFKSISAIPEKLIKIIFEYRLLKYFGFSRIHQQNTLYKYF